MDWKSWTSGPLPLAPDQIMADASRLIDGGRGCGCAICRLPDALEEVVEEKRATGLGAKRRLAVLMLDERAGPVDRDRAARLLMEATAGQETDAALTLGRLVARGALPSLPPTDAARYLSIAAGFGGPWPRLNFLSSTPMESLQNPLKAHPPICKSGDDQHADCFEPGRMRSGDRSWSGLAGAQREECRPAVGRMVRHCSRRWPSRGSRKKLARAYENGIGIAADKIKAHALWTKRSRRIGHGLCGVAELELAAGSDPRLSSICC